MGRQEEIRKGVCSLQRIVLDDTQRVQDVPRGLQGITTDQLTKLTRTGLSVDQISQQAVIEMQRPFANQLSSKESPTKSGSHWTIHYI